MIDIIIGRNCELEELNRLYQTPNFQMAVIYGRRRVGKSALIRQFVSDKTAIFFTAVESGMGKNLQLFSGSIYRTLIPNMPLFPPFQSFEAALDFLSDYAKKQRIILVIDEYPYLAAAYKEIANLLRARIDSRRKETQIFLIICGSSINFMEKHVLGEKSPLFGQQTTTIFLKPLDYLDSAKFVPDYSRQEQALVYGVTGGNPKYLELFDRRLNVYENIIRLFFQENGFLFEEPVNLLKRELRDVCTYNSVLEALACGATKINELVAKTHTDTATISYCLKTLISIGLVRKEHAVTEEQNRKKTCYIISDNMFRFWYRFVPDANEFILMQEGKQYFNRAVIPKIEDYMKNIYEQMCRIYLSRADNAKKLNLNFNISRIGHWWGIGQKKRPEEKIDIVGINDSAKFALIGSCAYQDKSIPIESARKLLEKGGLIADYPSRQYVLCAKNFFTDEVIEFAEKNNILLLNLEDLYDES